MKAVAVPLDHLARCGGRRRGRSRCRGSCAWPCARPRSIAARIVRTASARPAKIASPIRKWPMLSSTISGSAAIVSAVSIVRGRGRHGPRGRGACASLAPSPDAPPFGLAPPPSRPSASASHQAPVWISITGAPSAAAASIWPGSAAMNSETRMPASRSFGDRRRELRRAGRRRRGRLRWCAPARRSGTRQAACGLVLQRDRDHLVGRRHFEIERLGDLGLQPRDVVVADVAAVLAQMRGDAVGAGRDRELGRAHRIGMPPAARVADGRDVVDVDAEAKM